MNIKNILRPFIVSITLFLFITMLFSLTTELNTQTIIPDIFSAIYENADTKSQQSVIKLFQSNCQILSTYSQDDLIQKQKQLEQFCFNQTKQELLQDSCDNYEQIKTQLSSQEAFELKQACENLDSQELAKNCELLKNQKTIQNTDLENEQKSQNQNILENLDSIKNTCIKHNQGSISNKQFFLNIISLSLPSQISQIQNTQNLNINKKVPNTILFSTISIFEKITENSLILFLLSFLFMTLLFIGELSLFLKKISSMLINSGIIIFFPFLILKLYSTYFPIDTSIILQNIGNGTLSPEIQLQTIKTLLPLLALNFYTTQLIITAVTIIILGIILKILLHKPQYENNPRQKHIDEHVNMQDYHKNRSI